MSRPQSEGGGETENRGEQQNVDYYALDLNELPNGDWKPTETCEFIEAMREWREKSASSKVKIG